MRSLSLLRNSETDNADALYNEEAKVIAEAERLLGSGLDGPAAKLHYEELLLKYKELLEEHKRVQRRSDQSTGQLKREQEKTKALLVDLERSVQELKGLGDIIQAVNSSLELAHVLKVIVDQAVGLCGADAGSIYT